MLIVASAVREELKKMGMMTSGDLPEALSKCVSEMLKKGADRCKGNGRQTVRPVDL